MFRFFLLFTLLPALELYLLIEVGSAIGAAETIMIIIITGILGAYYSRSQGLSIWQETNRKLAQGQVPTDSAIQGLMVLVGGLLLITPGFITDIFGFSLVMPWTRKILVKMFKRSLMNQTGKGRVVFYSNINGQETFYTGDERDVTSSATDELPASEQVIDIDKDKP